eukprot:4239356-Pyramimonas_sp.AAC.1
MPTDSDLFQHMLEMAAPQKAPEPEMPPPAPPQMRSFAEASAEVLAGSPSSARPTLPTCSAPPAEAPQTPAKLEMQPAPKALTPSPTPAKSSPTPSPTPVHAKPYAKPDAKPDDDTKLKYNGTWTKCG